MTDFDGDTPSTVLILGRPEGPCRRTPAPSARERAAAASFDTSAPRPAQDEGGGGKVSEDRRRYDTWAAAREALDRAHDAGRAVRVWLRDDDCVAVTPALDRLADLCAGVGLPILLAVIPEPAEAGLAPWIGGHPSVVPCQHGFAHRDHAAPGERARELGGRSPRAVLDELARGRAKLRELFGGALSDVLVPPWNRIDEAVIPHLSGSGFSALSCFGPPPAASPIRRLDADLDIIDWRRGRVGRSLADLSGRLAGILDRQDTIGILTHHLAHDAAAWAALDTMLDRLAAHPAVRFTDAASLPG